MVIVAQLEWGLIAMGVIAIKGVSRIALEKLWSLVPDAVFAAAKETKGGNAPVIDITAFGFHKLLGNGTLPNVPVIVKAKFFTKLAEEKVKQAGGACLLAA